MTTIYEYVQSQLGGLLAVRTDPTRETYQHLYGGPPAAYAGSEATTRGYALMVGGGSYLLFPTLEEAQAAAVPLASSTELETAVAGGLWLGSGGRTQAVVESTLTSQAQVPTVLAFADIARESASMASTASDSSSSPGVGAVGLLVVGAVVVALALRGRRA